MIYFNWRKFESKPVEYENSTWMSDSNNQIRCPRDFAPRDLALPWPNPKESSPPGPNPLGSRPPCAPPFRVLAPPPPPLNDTFQRIFLYLDLATKKYGLAIYLTMVCASQIQSQCCLIFSKVGVDYLVIVYVNIVLQLLAWFCWVFLILPNLSIVSWVILVSDLYIFTNWSCQLMKAYFYFLKSNLKITV